MDLSISVSTGTAIVNLVALNLPALLLKHNSDLASLNRHYVFSYCLSKRALHILSPDYTIITHAFNHIDNQHFIGNMYSMISSAAFLNLGFLKTNLIFFSGVIAGVLGHIAETFVRNETIINLDVVKNYIPTSIFSSVESVNRPIYSLIGASAGAYSLMGAEMSSLVIQVIQTLNCYTILHNFSYFRVRLCR